MKRCPALKCESPKIQNNKLMCEPHLKMVPPYLKRKIYKAFLDIGATNMQEHHRICAKIGPRAWHDRLRVFHELRDQAVAFIVDKKIERL